MKQTFKTLRKGNVEIIYSQDHFEKKHVTARSLRNGRIEWKCNICGKKFTAMNHRADEARMKAWNCAESHFDDTKNTVRNKEICKNL